MEEEQLGHWTPSLAGQPRSQAPATTSRGVTAGALLRVVALVWVPVLTELVMDGALLQVTALCYSGRGAPTHRGHAPMRPAPRTTCSHDAGKGPYGLRRLQPVERLQPRHEERTPVNCGLTMRPGSVIVCSMQQPTVLTAERGEKKPSDCGLCSTALRRRELLSSLLTLETDP